MYVENEKHISESHHSALTLHESVWFLKKRKTKKNEIGFLGGGGCLFVCFVLFLLVFLLLL